MKYNKMDKFDTKINQMRMDISEISKEIKILQNVSQIFFDIYKHFKII